MVSFQLHNMAIIFDGKAYAAKKKLELAAKVEGLVREKIRPKLVSLLIGNGDGSELYTRLKKKAAGEIGAEFEIVKLDSGISSEDLVGIINRFNGDTKVHGIMIQMPLPAELKMDRASIVAAIDPQKDIDGLRGGGRFLRPTSRAIIQAIEEANRDTNLTCVVVGATGMVGMPLTSELKNMGYRVIECNTKTIDLKAETLKGDILVSATGKANLVKADMVKEGAIVIDVGYPVGDVEASVREKASFITPVPGGIGPVTISCLLENLIEACYNSQS